MSESPRSRVGQVMRTCDECGHKVNKCSTDCPRRAMLDAMAPVMTQSEVAKELGMSRARVQQIESSALRKLRFRLAGLR